MEGVLVAGGATVPEGPVVDVGQLAAAGIRCKSDPQGGASGGRVSPGRGAQVEVEEGLVLREDIVLALERTLQQGGAARMITGTVLSAVVFPSVTSWTVSVTSSPSRNGARALAGTGTLARASSVPVTAGVRETSVRTAPSIEERVATSWTPSPYKVANPRSKLHERWTVRKRFPPWGLDQDDNIPLWALPPPTRFSNKNYSVE